MNVQKLRSSMHASDVIFVRSFGIGGVQPREGDRNPVVPDPIRIIVDGSPLRPRSVLSSLILSVLDPIEADRAPIAREGEVTRRLEISPSESFKVITCGRSRDTLEDRAEVAPLGSRAIRPGRSSMGLVETGWVGSPCFS